MRTHGSNKFDRQMSFASLLDTRASTNTHVVCFFDLPSVSAFLLVLGGALANIWWECTKIQVARGNVSTTKRENNCKTLEELQKNARVREVR